MGNGENRRDRIDGKNEVGEFDTNQHGKHGSRGPFGALFHKEFIAMKLLSEGYHFTKQSESDIFFKIDDFICCKEHLDSSEKEDAGKNISDPCEIRQ